MAILVTGGAGYIGSHTVVELLNQNQKVIIVDNFSNSKVEVINRITQITGKQVTCYTVDVCDQESLDNVFIKENIESVIHFAAYKAVGESVQKPLEYYDNNVNGLLTLLRVMKKHDVKNIVFSSSATVYGLNHTSPLKEELSVSANSPYGQTKIINEQILKDVAHIDPKMRVGILRYFNPIGAHASGLIGEDPNGIPNNLMPYITQVAIGKLPKLNVFGNTYPTLDGTGVRDYIHVVDLALGHLAMLDYLTEHAGYHVVNLGCGHGYSVLEIVNTFMEINKVDIPYEITKPREGDVAICYADTHKAQQLLHFTPTKTLADMCHDSYQFQLKNPQGIN